MSCQPLIFQHFADYTANYFNIYQKHNLAYKTMLQPNAETWKELAPNICRQRLYLFSDSCRQTLHSTQYENFLKELCDILKMTQLTPPLVHNNTAWMHWETSGCIMDWRANFFELDIYTCKPFNI